MPASRFAPFCAHRSDKAGCEASIIAAYQDGELESHCVTTGLRSGCLPCEDEIAYGFRQRQNDTLLSACEWILLWSFREDVAAGKALFERQIRGLILSKIDGFGSRARNLRDDIYQEVYLALERRFRNPKPIEGHIARYVAIATERKVWEMVNKRPHSRLPEKDEEMLASKEASGPLFPTDLADCWDDWDRRLATSIGHDLIDRILFAQRYVLHWIEAKRIPTKKVLAEWKQLGALSDSEITARVKSVHEWLQSLGDKSPAYCCVRMIDRGCLQAWEVPLVFALCGGLQTDEVVSLVRRLASATVTFVDGREGDLRATLVRRSRE